MMRLPSRAELDRDEVRRGGLYAFLRLAWPLLEPGTRFVGGWHLELICRHLEAISRGELRRLVINIPPGLGKSSLVCVAWIAWDWIAHPERRWIVASYSQRLSRRDSIRTHTLVTSSWYQDRWPTRVDHDETESSDQFSTTSGGLRFATTTGGQATGWHPHVKVVDDPNPPRDASGGKAVTAAALQAVADWWTGTMGTRGEPATVAEVVIQQRVHERDLSGVLLETGDYVHLRLPMEYEADTPCETPWGHDPRTEEGELLCPERLGRASVDALKRALRTPSNVAAQAQQRPNPRGGSTFQRRWLRLFDVLPATRGQWLQTWDCTYGVAESQDYVVGQVWYSTGGVHYLVDQMRARLTLHGTVDAVRELAERWPLSAITVLVEAKANGPAVVQLLESELVGIEAVNQGNKETRAHAAAAEWEAGRVCVPAGADWLAEWIDEHVGWPHKRHDDQVDAACHALAYLRSNDTSAYAEFVREMRGAA